MLRKWLAGMLAVMMVSFMVSGCGTTSGGGGLSIKVDEVSSVGTSKVTVSGSVSYSDGNLDVNLNPVLVSDEAVVLSSGKVRVRVGTVVTTITSAETVEVTLPTISNKPVDIAFILDNTGSMSGAISGSINSISAFASSLEAQGKDVRFGLVTYGDSAEHPTPADTDPVGDQPHARPVMDFDNAAALRSILSAEVKAEGGNDWPENPLDAIMYAYNNLSWRDSAQRVLINITDADGHQNVTADTSTDNKCTTTKAAVATALMGRATVFVVGHNYTSPVPEAGCYDPRALADGLGEGRVTPEANTGGKFIELNLGSFDLTALGIDTALARSYTLRFSYSFDAGTYYILVEIDTDGDGIFDSNMLIKVTLS
jgi:hypothetical protein